MTDLKKLKFYKIEYCIFEMHDASYYEVMRQIENIIFNKKNKVILLILKIIF